MNWLSIRPAHKLALWCIGLFVVLWFGSLEGLARYLEDRVWEHHDAKVLRVTGSALNFLKDHRLVPRSYKSRFQGLIGDSEFYSGRFEGAMESYIKSFDLYFRQGPDEEDFDQFGKLKDCRFVHGFRAYEAEVPDEQVLDESMFVIEPLPVSSERNCVTDFNAIAPFDERTKKEIDRIFYEVFYSGDSNQPEERVRNLLGAIDSLYQASNVRDVITEACRLGAFVKLETGDLESPLKINSLFRLLLVDSWVHHIGGNSLAAANSFDSAFQILNYFYQNPTVLGALVVIAQRQKMIDFFDSENGGDFAQFFQDKHRMPDDLLERCLQGEYWGMKTVFEGADKYESPSELRFKQKVEKRHWEFYQRLLLTRSEDSVVPPQFDYSKEVSTLFHKHRSMVYRMRSLSEADGRAFAEFVANVRAATVHGTMSVNLGRIWESAEIVLAGEAALVNR